MMVGLSARPFWTAKGRFGTGGIVPVPKPLLKRDPNPPGERREGEAMVA